MFKKILAVAAVAAVAVPAQATLTAGDIAIIGRINNGTPDSFAVLALSDIAAGEVIYFTDNGWTGTGYRGATDADGDGNENLTKWTVSTSIAAGTVVLSTSSDFTPTVPSIPGSTSGAFASLSLNTSGDQIYAFQNSANNDPLFATATQTNLFAIDDTNGFEAATSSSTGGIATGLTLGTTAVTFNAMVAGGYAVKASVLAGPAQTKAQWLATIGNASNWAATSTLSTAAVAVTAVPEPSTYAMLLAGLASIGFVARRRRA